MNTEFVFFTFDHLPVKNSHLDILRLVLTNSISFNHYFMIEENMEINKYKTNSDPGWINK